MYLAGWSNWLEGRLGLPILYLLRGATTPPAAAAIIGLDEAARENLALDAHRMAASTPRLGTCLPASSLPALARARSVEDWPRAVHACLLRALAEDGAEAIVLDIHFRAPGAPEDDAMFSAALRSSSRVYLLEEIRFDKATGVAIRRGPLRAFAEAAAGYGYFLVDEGGEGSVRYVAGVDDFSDATPVHRQVLGRGADPVSPSARIAFARLSLYGPAGAVPTLRMIDYLAQPPDPDRFAGRVVFVGAASVDAMLDRDTFASAWKGAGSGRVSGVELLATAYLNELEEAGLRRLPPVAEMAAVLALAAACALVASLIGGIRGAAVALAVVAAHVAAAAWAFTNHALWLPVAMPVVVALPVTLFLHGLLGYRRALGWLFRLLPPQWAGEMARRDRLEDASPGVGTALMFDLVSSTAFAERFGEGPLHRRLGALYGCVDAAVRANGGIVIKFTGDGGLAVFEARTLGPGHALAACEAAIALDGALRDVNAGVADGEPPILIRVGIQSGRMTLGYVGGDARGALDAIGDAVNVAARLEALCKSDAFEGEFRVAVGDAAVALLPEGVVPLRPLGPFRLRGKANDVEVWRLSLPAQGPAERTGE